MSWIAHGPSLRSHDARANSSLAHGVGVLEQKYVARSPPPDASSGLAGRIEFVEGLVIARLNRGRIFLLPKKGEEFFVDPVSSKPPPPY